MFGGPREGTAQREATLWLSATKVSLHRFAASTNLNQAVRKLQVFHPNLSRIHKKVISENSTWMVYDRLVDLQTEGLKD